jgi:hypothetical protein
MVVADSLKADHQNYPGDKKTGMTNALQLQ